MSLLRTAPTALKKLGRVDIPTFSTESVSLNRDEPPQLLPFVRLAPDNDQIMRGAGKYAKGYQQTSRLGRRGESAKRIATTLDWR